MSKRDLVKQLSRNLSSLNAAAPDKRAAAPSGDLQSQEKNAELEVAEPVEEKASAGQTSGGGMSGKQAAFWLDDEDRSIFHEIGMHLYAQGIKPSNNVILRAAIRLVPRDHRLVEIIRELNSSDGRKIRHQSKRK